MKSTVPERIMLAATYDAKVPANYNWPFQYYFPVKKKDKYHLLIVALK